MAQADFKGFGGLTLRGDEWGSPEDPSVLLLHGGGQSRKVWTEAARALVEAGRHVITVDLRGHGESDWPADGRYDFDAYVEDLRAVLAQLGSRPVVVASSLGGWIAAAALGGDGANLATGLVLADAPPRIDPALARSVGDELKKLAAERGAAVGWDPRFLDGMDTPSVPGRLASVAPTITVPTLFVRGSASALTSQSDAEDFVGLLPNAEFAVVEDAGHHVAAERAELFNGLLLDFLERRIPRAAPEYRAGSDARTLRDAMGCFATGVTIITTYGADGAPVGLTANSFTSVSLDPALLLVCIARTASSLASLMAAERFGVNMLHIGQQPTSNNFTRRDIDRFAVTPWEDGEFHVPLLTGSLANFECERQDVHDAGDHVLMIGRVLRARFEPRRDPLLYFRGRYRRIHIA